MVTCDPVAADQWLHVSSSLNRESILEHGLQSALMGRARGIAGSHVPERPGCFLASHGLDFFVHMNNTGGLVDVWEVLDVDPGLLLNDPEPALTTSRQAPPPSRSAWWVRPSRWLARMTSG